MSGRTIIGVALLILGIIALAYQASPTLCPRKKLIWDPSRSPDRNATPFRFLPFWEPLL